MTNLKTNHPQFWNNEFMRQFMDLPHCQVNQLRATSSRWPMWLWHQTIGTSLDTVLCFVSFVFVQAVIWQYICFASSSQNMAMDTQWGFGTFHNSMQFYHPKLPNLVNVNVTNCKITMLMGSFQLFLWPLSTSQTVRTCPGCPWAPQRATAQHGWVQVTMAWRTPLVRRILGHGDIRSSGWGRHQMFINVLHL